MFRRIVRSTVVVLATMAVLLFTLVQTTLAANITADVEVTIVCTPAGIIDGEQAYTIDHYATVSGFPANTPGNVVIVIEGFGDFREIQITTDAAGAGSGELLHFGVPTTGPVPGTYWEATATFGGETATVDGFINCGGAPVSKDECKDGGYAAFGFKNQGDCVSFISTGGGNPPAGP
jgi:hypothetical protein